MVRCDQPKIFVCEQRALQQFTVFSMKRKSEARQVRQGKSLGGLFVPLGSQNW